MKSIISISLALILFIGCNTAIKENEGESILIETLQGTSLDGSDLISAQLDQVKDSARISNYILAKDKYNDNPDNADALIWYGRRTAYLGDYLKAIEIFSEGITKFPEDARMYRHRGHRYISLRKLDLAIKDLEMASQLIDGKEDKVEPDGIPNARNIPVSTTHRNIWYHLGLAYYLKDDMENALLGFKECKAISDNPDMYVASSHWVYMILRRMNMAEEAALILEPISSDMDVYENMSYHSLLLFYKEEITEDELLGGAGEVSTANNAVVYGLGNWYLYNNDTEKAKKIFSDLVENGIWAAFGTLAAEADLARLE